MTQLNITAEELAYWYFRLNGFLTIQNFIIHDERIANQRTDVDILGVRFPFRSEINMEDDAWFTKVSSKPLYIITEVKTGLCNLNGPWTSPDKKNMQRVLKSLGSLEESLIANASKDLYDQGFYEDEGCRVNLICVGKDENNQMKSKFPHVPQILFKEILEFIWSRFKKFHEQKKVNQQWDTVGQDLWRCYDLNRDNKQEFVNTVLNGIR